MPKLSFLYWEKNHHHCLHLCRTLDQCDISHFKCLHRHIFSHNLSPIQRYHELYHSLKWFLWSRKHSVLFEVYIRDSFSASKPASMGYASLKLRGKPRMSVNAHTRTWNINEACWHFSLIKITFFLLNFPSTSFWSVNNLSKNRLNVRHPHALTEISNDYIYLGQKGAGFWWISHRRQFNHLFLLSSNAYKAQ